MWRCESERVTWWSKRFWPVSIAVTRHISLLSKVDQTLPMRKEVRMGVREGRNTVTVSYTGVESNGQSSSPSAMVLKFWKARLIISDCDDRSLIHTYKNSGK